MSAERAAALGGAAALAAPVVLPETAPVGADEGSSFATLHGLYWLVAGLAAERPQLLVVDDGHWADEASARFLAFLRTGSRSCRCCCWPPSAPTRRPDQRACTPAPRVTVVTPGALSVDATARALGDGAEPAFAAACHAATGGNPLLVRRLAVGLRERGVPFTRPAWPRRRDRRPQASPARCGARWRGWRRSPVALARAVAVLGDEAPLAIAAPLAELSAAPRRRPPTSSCARASSRTSRPLALPARARARRGAATLTAVSGPRRTATRPWLAEHGAPDRASPRTCCTPSRAAMPGWPRRSPPRAVARSPPAPRRGTRPARSRARGAAGGGRPARAAAGARARVHAPRRPGARSARPGGLRCGRRRDEALTPRSRSCGRRARRPSRSSRRSRLIEPAIEAMAGRDRELELLLEAARLMMLFLSRDRPRGAAEQRAPRRADGLVHRRVPTAAARGARPVPTARPAAEIAAPVERISRNAEAVAALGPETPWMAFLIGMLFKTDRLEAAGAVAGAALAEATRTGSAGGFAIASVWLAWIALRRGEGEAAEAHARAAVDAAPPAAGSTPPAPAGSPRCSSSGRSSTTPRRSSTPCARRTPSR